MDNESYEKVWVKFLKKQSQQTFFVDEETGNPYFFTYPHCATCQFWHPIHRDGLDQVPAPHEADRIEEGLAGKMTGIIDLEDGGLDSFQHYVFYGWCKRYPPTHRDTYSVTNFRTLFSLVSKIIPQKISDYQFPLLSHSNTCGEWKKGDWVDRLLEQYKKERKKQKTQE